MYPSSEAEMHPILRRHWLGLAACAVALLCIYGAAADAQQTSQSGHTSIPAAHLLQPAELAQIMHSSSGEKPLILQVGSHVMFSEAHIPGSEYAGAAGQESGLQALRKRLQGMPRNRFVVIYCGCCPWLECPNIRPAYRQLISMGFTHVMVLHLQDNFGVNWVDKGYPVVKVG